WIEYAAASVLIFLFRLLPFRVTDRLSSLLGNLLFALLPRRRRIALDNVRKAFAGEKTEAEIGEIARRSCKSLFLTAFELIKSRDIFSSPDVIGQLKKTNDTLEELFRKAKKIHDESGGCIFVTPHIGNWELLPAVSSVVGIPLVMVARPLDNAYLERLFYKTRTASGQMIIPKKNAMFTLQRTLQQGKSIGMLTDQSTMKGILVDFFGRKATTTPVPAVLAITKKRPIVVVACCRTADFKFEGFVSDPIRPGEFAHEKDEIYRITLEMNREMEAIIRKYPEQYFWLHNRWKRYEGLKEVMS
nr:lysophospholipid acyltransferase family protein [Nitrospiraceae bacterium]